MAPKRPVIMRFLYWSVLFFAVAEGGYMLVDGLHALLTGGYIAPGPAGELGPWSGLVALAGIDPLSSGMRAAFVVFGVAYLGAVLAYANRVPRGSTALGVVAVATLWYLPVGTLCSLLVLAGLWMRHRRPRGRNQAPKRR